MKNGILNSIAICFLGVSLIMTQLTVRGIARDIEMLDSYGHLGLSVGNDEQQTPHPLHVCLILGDIASASLNGSWISGTGGCDSFTDLSGGVGGYLWKPKESGTHGSNTSTETGQTVICGQSDCGGWGPGRIEGVGEGAGSRCANYDSMYDCYQGFHGGSGTVDVGGTGYTETIIKRNADGTYYPVYKRS